MIFTGESSEIKEVLIKGEDGGKWIKPYMGEIEWGHFTIEPQGVREPGFRFRVTHDEMICGPISSILAIRTNY